MGRSLKRKKPPYTYLSTYGIYVFGFFGWSDAEFDSFCFKNWGQTLPPMPNASGLCYMFDHDRGTMIPIRVPAYEHTAAWHGLFMHEVIHAALLALHSRGQHTVDTAHHEFVTYLAQQIAVVLLDDVMPKAKKKK